MSSVLDRRENKPDVPEHPVVVAQRHNRRLLHAIQVGADVLYGTVQHAMRAVTFQQDGCNIIATVYLVGTVYGINGQQIEIIPAESPAPIKQLSPNPEHYSVLLHSLHLAHPVTYEGLWRFVHTIRLSRGTEGPTATVWLAGMAEPVPADALVRIARPEPLRWD